MKTDIRRETNQEALEVLKQAIIMEIAGLQFFLTAAEKAESKKAQKMFRQLAEDEAEHKNTLEKVMKTLAKGENNVDIPLVSKAFNIDHPVIGQELKESLKTTWFDHSALNIGIMLEQRAISFYTEELKKTDDSGLKELFDWLVSWERTHLDALLKVEQALREQYWFDRGFWPVD
jgi:rubrerythrin